MSELDQLGHGRRDPVTAIGLGRTAGGDIVQKNLDEDDMERVLELMRR